jgi:integrase
MATLRMRITDDALKELPLDFVGTVRDDDLSGFMLRGYGSGKKTFAFEYRVPGAGRSVPPRTFTIGTWPTLKAARARVTAEDLNRDVAHGRDPAAERQAQKQAAQQKKKQQTVAALIGEDAAYERALKRDKIVNWKVALSALRRELSPTVKNKSVDQVTRTDIVSAITAVDESGRPGAAADLHKHAVRFLEWCVEQGHCSANVMAGRRRRKQTRAQRLNKKHVGMAFNDDQLVAVWMACEADGSPFARLMQLALCSALRRSELAQLERKAHIKIDRIDVPAEITKTGYAHDVPLLPLARRVLAKTPKTTSALVFSYTGKRMSGWTKLINRIKEASGVPLRGLHDARRTVRTLMSRLGVAEDIAELSIGHVRADLIARYNRDRAWAARCQAFARVNRHIIALINKRGKQRRGAKQALLATGAAAANT